MNPHTIWQSQHFKLSQSFSFRLPGYLFVEALSGVPRLSDLQTPESQELGLALKLAEHLVHTLIRPERTYVLRFGESDERVHFHVVPRTTKLLNFYLRSQQDAPSYNGALITAWLWANADTLGHTEEEIQTFVSAARQASGELTFPSSGLPSAAAEVRR
jgi:diadenosine tetraphosphate (Ap4A) HIT family hydrolase